MENKKIFERVFDGNRDIGEVCDAVESKTGLKLMARNETDIVHGFVNGAYDSKTNKTTVSAFLYVDNENPTKTHKTTLAKPTAAQENNIKNELEAVK